MKCAAWPLLALAALASGALAGRGQLPDEQGPAADVAIELVTGVKAVEFGKAFGLTVRLRWREGLAPDWREAELAPLVVRPTSVERAVRGGIVHETRRYLAYAFQVGPVEVAPRFAAADPAAGVAVPPTALALPLRLMVASSLPPDDEGVAELPGPPVAEPRPWVGQVVAWALGLLVLGVAVLRFRRGRAAAGASLRQQAKRVARLQQLAAMPAGLAAPQAPAWCAEVAQLLRGHVGARSGVVAPHASHQELLADARVVAALGREEHAAVVEVLRACDAVGFGGKPLPAGVDERLAAIVRAAPIAPGVNAAGRA
ncbi:MAG: hypothetical protein AAF628_01250 [Planctomycetota bacterium]